jgi:hypothetical protein
VVAAHDPRSGTVLLIVIVFLTLFAALGVAFMFYADSDAQAADAFRASVEPKQPYIDPEAAFAMFLQQLIYDCKDDESGVYSALRGHGLLRTMYGQNLGVNTATGAVTLTDAAGNPISNIIAFDGTGRLHWTHPVNGANPLSGQDDFNFPNYSYLPQHAMLRDPERYGIRTALRAPNAADNRKPFVGGFNAPYTACDLNTMCLAAVTADGTVMQPSYFRDYNGFGSLAPNNANWYNTVDKRLSYMVLRPRPADHPTVTINGVTKPGFPAPEDAGGDVQNLKWGKGNDSIWLYTGAPIYKLPDGRMYTMLYAPLIIDLDGKINLNVVGNVAGTGGNPAGNQGWGPWEVNPAWILGVNELKNLFLGVPNAPANTPQVIGRYGKDGQPGSTPPNAGQTSPLAIFNRNNKIPGFYAKADFRGVATSPWNPPTAGQWWPTYNGYGNASAADRFEHPELYNVLNPTAINPANPALMNRAFSIAEMDKLLRFGDIGTEAMASDLFMLCPSSFNAFTTAALRKRNMVTTTSWDTYTVATSPWLYKGAANGPYRMTSSTWGTPTGAGSIAFPAITNFPGAASGREFTGDWRGNPFTINKADLNQLLPAYPTLTWTYPDPATGAAKPAFRLPQKMVGGNLVVDTTSAAYTTFINAQTARQNLAQSLFTVLVQVTGATDPTTYAAATASAPITAAEINGIAYLAQLAVNIVDYIDDDDIITPFNWSATATADFKTALAATGNNGWVFGVELPKAVINEVYAQTSNDPADPGLLGSVAQKDQKANQYFVDVWAELHNPLKTDNNLLRQAPDVGGNARLHMFTLPNLGAGSGYPVYKLVVTDKNTGLHLPANSMGQPDPTVKVRGTMGNEFEWTPGVSTGFDRGQILPNNGRYAAPNLSATVKGNQGSNNGFYMVGPKDATGTAVPFPTDPAVTDPNEAPPAATASAAGLRYSVPVATLPPTGQVPAPTVLLQRLLCPYLPPDPNPTLPSGAVNPTYNPYITVDYFEDVPVNVGANFGPVASANMAMGPAPAPGFLGLTSRSSYGRKQPYGALTSEVLAQVAVYPPTPPANPKATPPVVPQNIMPRNQPNHTFFQQNYRTELAGAANVAYTGYWPPALPGGYPAFDWLAHLDRPLVSPMELLYVAETRPHELTQRFVVSGTPHQQRVGGGTGWFKNDNRLYRFFEYVQTWPYKNITPPAATAAQRLPGKVNINTVWDPEIFYALCDPQPGNHYTNNDVLSMFSLMLTLRSPRTVTINGLTRNWPGTNEKPFHPLSTGFSLGGGVAADPLFPNGGGGVQLTMLRSSAGTAASNGTRLFELPAPAAGPNHPMRQYELLNKIYNSVTTRSNVFAAWVTVGFFEVNQVTIENGAKRIYLGQELGRVDNKQVRHRMFAIVDRSTVLGNAAANTTTVNILNGTTTFNPHSNPSLIPYFTVIE